MSSQRTSTSTTTSASSLTASLGSPTRRGLLAAGGIGGIALLAAGCKGSSSSSGDSATLDGETVSGVVDGDFWDEKSIHTLSVVFDEDDYDEMIEAYVSSQDKNWIEADVEIDGKVFKKAGMKLKGNSSLRSLAGGQGGGPGGAVASDGGGDASASDGGGDDPTSDTDTSAAASDGGGASDASGASDAGGAAGGGFPGGGNDEGDGSISKDDPTGLPWMIRLDKYTDGQSYSGRSRFVVRGNNTETSMNEAVALDVLALAGVPAEKYAYTRFSANGADAQLRLVLDVPDDDQWNDDAFDGTGATLKADSNGDYSYRGDTADDYADAFDAKFVADDLEEDDVFAALGSFLKFVNDSEDDDFASGLDDRFDVDGFATYLAVQELVQNTDDIDGPGNNSYLHYDPSSKKWSVVAWDQNLSFGGMGMGGGGGAPGGGAQASDGGGNDAASDSAVSDGGGDPPTGGQMPGGGQMPEGGEMPDGGGKGGGGGMGGNTLAERFMDDDTFSDLYDSTLASVKKAVFTSGDATKRVKTLSALLKSDASDLVSSDDITSDAKTITDVIDG
ncbi:CotH kinase family protein [Brachybacterium sp. MASK1Z-5]|uniref:CotH kinase family protein n=1 Tax=Brachybacterium halotolerans TaxID=2795215 RepID=A0ABS1BAA6_9MICO|nr:CotH kinase family protein [Brachybacterium halotolerans]MBK0331591.1 CotH kinase family protein [Brachybacterium halotolerans]